MTERDNAFRVWLNERHTGALQRRRFTFPHVVDPETVKARLSRGLLKILVPKARKKDRQSEMAEA